MQHSTLSIKDEKQAVKELKELKAAYDQLRYDSSRGGFNTSCSQRTDRRSPLCSEFEKFQESLTAEKAKREELRDKLRVSAPSVSLGAPRAFYIRGCAGSDPSGERNRGEAYAA